MTLKGHVSIQRGQTGKHIALGCHSVCQAVVHACYKATLLHIFLNIWCQILFLGDLYDAALFCAVECGTINYIVGLQ